MGWNDRDERMTDMYDEAFGIAEYYSEMAGREVEVVVENYEDVYIESSRTNGREYFTSLIEADNRLRQLYSDILLDDGDTSDPYEGF